MSDIKLYNDDCINVLKNIKDKTIDLICTDIPYELDIASTKSYTLDLIENANYLINWCVRRTGFISSHICTI
jgi:DNA modification methylase